MPVECYYRDGRKIDDLSKVVVPIELQINILKKINGEDVEYEESKIKKHSHNKTVVEKS